MTVYEQLAAAYPLHFQRIVECVYAWDPRNGAKLLASSEPWENNDGCGWILYEAFDWKLTDEGPIYWRALADGGRHS